MKKLLLMALAMTCLWTTTHAQVGINTTNPTPGTILDINASDKGILIPRVNIDNPSSGTQIEGGTTNGLLVYNTNQTTGEGFYYWYNTQWIPMGSEFSWRLTGNSGINPDTNFIGTVTNDHLAFRTNNVERMRILSSNGNVGINTSTPNTILEVNATDSGILIPRVALTSANNSAPIDSPTQSELIFNTAISGTGENAVSPGYYYWDGYRWTRLGGSHIVYENNIFHDGSSGNGLLMQNNAGAVSGAISFTHTITLDKPTLVEFKVSFEIEISRFNNVLPPNNGNPILYGMYLMNDDLSKTIIADMNSYTNTASTGTIYNGNFTLGGNGTIFLPAGVHQFNLIVIAAGGGSQGYSIYYLPYDPLTDNNLIQILYHE